MRKICLILPILLAFAFTIPVVAIHGLNIGVDIFFHLKIAENWATGNVGMVSEVVMSENHFPYPPLFHFLLVPGVWLNIETAWALGFQVLLLPLAVASFMFLVYKTLDVSSAFFGGLLVLGSVAYIDRVIQPQPQALNFILWPLALYFFLLVKDRRGFVLSSVLMVWNHGIVSVSALGGSLMEKLRHRDWKTILFFLLGSSFILAISAIYLFSGLSNYGSRVDTNQEFLFWHDPLFVLRYLRLLIAGFPVAMYHMVQYFRGIEMSELTKISIFNIGLMAVMVPVWADRWVQYCTIPLALLVLEQVKNSSRFMRFVWGYAISALAFLMVGEMYFL